MRPVTQKSKELRKYLNNPESCPLVCLYLLEALKLPPLHGEWMLIKKVQEKEKVVCEAAKKALDMLIDNNRSMYHYTNMINTTSKNNLI